MTEKLKIIKPTVAQVVEFLRESNAIEGVYGKEALVDAKRAWDFLMKKKHITEKHVLRVHKLLAHRIAPDIAGKFRQCDVWIGGQRKLYVDDVILLEQVKAVLDLMTKSIVQSDDREKSAQDSHVLFEGVHPFVDFNGRTGRILWTWHRLQMGLPIQIIHVGEEQNSYYSWFR